MTVNYEVTIAVHASLRQGQSGRGSATGLTLAADCALLLGQQECCLMLHSHLGKSYLGWQANDNKL
jgi:hypothetical protein